LTFYGSSILLADGGALVFQKQAGPFMISVFSSPTPSVMVQNAGNHSVIEDARVALKLQKGAVEINALATREQATNKLLYAAQVNLPPGLDGDWRLSVHVATSEVRAEAEGILRVSPAPAAVVAYWPYFAVVPLVVALFALNRWLKLTRR
jgi:hypothetical protein